MDENETTDGMDRRSLIKRAGIVTAGAAAWSTPMVSSLASRAYAGSPQPSCSDNCGGCGTYDIDNPCGRSGPLDLCVCGRTTSGRCVCWEDYPCGSVASCGADDSCPDGYVCMVTCCGTRDCVPLCGTNVRARTTQQTSGQKTGTGAYI